MKNAKIIMHFCHCSMVDPEPIVTLVGRRYVPELWMVDKQSTIRATKATKPPLSST